MSDQPIKIDTTEKAPQKAAFSVKELVYKYISFLPLFILSLVLCLGLGYMYIRYKVPVYKGSVQVLVRNPARGAGVNDLIAQGVSGVRPITLDNEMQTIKTKVKLERVVAKGNFNILYSKEGNIKNSDAYKATPFTLTPSFVPDSSKIYTIKLKTINNQGGEIETPKGLKKFTWGDSLHIYGFKFKLTKNYTIESTNDPYVIKWLPIGYVAAQMQSKLSVTTLSQKTSVLILSLAGESRKKVQDFLDLLVEEIINSDITLKQETAMKTLDFIEGRLNLVGKELDNLEGDIASLKKANRFFDVSSEYGYLQGRLTKAEEAAFGFQTDIKTIDKIDDYVRNNRSVGKSKVIPSNLGVDDMSFNGLIAKYNDLQLQMEKIEINTPKLNDRYKELEIQLQDLKLSLLEAGALLKQSKQEKLKTFVERYDVDLNKIAELPDKDKMFIDINRQKSIKEKLYMYLLQKREETAISTISTESNFQKMDAATVAGEPIEPQQNQIKIFALVLGLLIPIAIIYILEILNDKITTRVDITNKTTIPVAGEISHVNNVRSIVVANSRNVVAEQFRILRSNLEFILSGKRQSSRATTLLVTSSISGEGKSFVSLNLAAVLALTGKKVALLEFDLRKIKGIQIDEIEDNNDRGITNFLIGQNNNLSTLYKEIDKYPNLHIYNTGPIPPNPAELIISPAMENLFKYIKENYDYAVVDSAPVGLVSDSFSLNKYADAVMYIVRQRYTFKKQLDFINDLRKDGKLSNMAIVVNDVNLSGRYGYYGYGYGYGYGYMYRYGGGYGYNRYVYGGRKKDPYFDANNKGYFDDNVKPNWWQRIVGRR